jgi:beta-lactamase class A
MIDKQGTDGQSHDDTNILTTGRNPVGKTESVERTIHPVCEKVRAEDLRMWFNPAAFHLSTALETRIDPMKLLALSIVLTLVSQLASAADRTVAAALQNRIDPDLQIKLERTVERLGLTRQAKAGNLAVALVDITDPKSPLVATINGDEMMYAASLPKIAILYATFFEIDRGRFPLDRKTGDSLTRMIRYSSNDDATKMLNLVGKRRVAEILQAEPFKLYDPAMNGGLWVGKEYAKGVAFRRDPLHNISHGATVLQTARFYYLLETGQLVSRKYTAQMKEMLGNPGINHKFVKGLNVRPGIKIYRKSGTWQDWHADSALVEAAGRKYIAVALAHSPNGGVWLEKLIVPMHDMVIGLQYASATQ